MHRTPALLILAAAATLPVGARAASVTDTQAVFATVVDSCSVTAGALTFPRVDLATGTGLTASTTINVVCSSGTAYQVGLDAGAGAGATVASRKLTRSDGTETVDYRLYRQSNRAMVWGNSVGVDTVSGTGNGNEQTIQVFGEITAGQRSRLTGEFADVLTATITY